MHGWGTRMLLKHYLDAGVSKAEMSRRFGVNERTIRRWIAAGQLERGSCGRASGVLGQVAGAAQAGRLQGDHRGASGGVPPAVRTTAVRRGAGSRLRRWIQPRAGLRARRAPARAGRGGGPLRDAAGASGARWTSGRSRCPGGGGTRFWWCWATRGCCGCDSTRGRRWRCWSKARRARSRGSAGCRRNCCSTRCARWWCRTTERRAASSC